MKKLKITASLCMAVGIMVVLFSCFSVFAANNPAGGQSVGFNNSSVLNLTLDTTPISFGNAEFDVASTSSGGDVSVKSNKNWTLSVKGTDFLGKDSDDNNVTIPISDLSVTMGQTNLTLTTGDQALKNDGSKMNNATIGSLNYSLTTTKDDPSGDNFSSTVTYTLSPS